MKSCLEQSLKSYNSIKIWCTITSKQYVLNHLMVKMSTKFQHNPMKTVGGVIRKRGNKVKS